VAAARPASRTWTSRRRLAWAVRLSTVLVPLVVAVLVMVGVSRIVARPTGALPSLVWYGLLLGVSYAASWAAGKVMARSLPLAALLEMSLSFPESAPSRLGLAQRGGSSAALSRLATAPPDESTQAAAERILKLLTALSAHDRFTRGHAERVRAYTDLIAANMHLTEGDRDRLRWAALLHDIGKLRVPSGLLNKPEKPTAPEWDQLKAHPIQGSLIAAPLLEWLRPMDKVIAEHHEKFDGTGYPVGLRGEQISQGARIVTVADCFEAMTAVRSYNKPMKREAALAELVRCAGTHFDPVVVRALLAVPQRRLLWAMGPTAWLAGLPWVGQGSLGALRAGLSHAGTAVISAGAVAVAAVAPTALFSPAHAERPAPLTPAIATSLAPSPTSLPSAGTSSAPGSPTTTQGPTPVRQTPAAKPAPGTPRHSKAPHHTPAKTPAPTTSRRGTVASTTPVAPTTSSPGTTKTGAPSVVPTTTQPTTQTTQAGVPTTPPAHPTSTPAPTSTAPQKPSPVPTSRVPTTVPTSRVPSTMPTPAATTTTAPPAAQLPPPTTTPAAPAAPALSCTATYKSTSSSKLAASITVVNTGTAISTGWTVTWSWESGNPKVTSGVNASVSQADKTVTAKSGLLSSVLLPKTSTVFTISGEGNPVSPVPTLSCVER
jgi:HD-GYP domain-containing protein (c-di-GMP phosphodiesterase class II)